MSLMTFRCQQVSFPQEAYVLVCRSDLILNILICVQKMNEGLTGLEQHESELILTEFSFLGELTLQNLYLKLD